ncbi:nuclear transcription factor Y subunit B-1-like [Punica granatum]|uniref:Transcription factor CBF/NF-Y/archaeal histone domain-containing protein n=2 Tax=Punica granatum TaxID=22663 RepID=A0A218WYP3_PUNGR|nr:nuclear transcription factor Y subunit B-1-like [Punica granatum]OWM78005.1 hypothetical protein CDL15_Pgr018574 [Punica granatum]PKI42172.1 hypothetical protein CRG98_037411 [Punica granatum]
MVDNNFSSNIISPSDTKCSSFTETADSSGIIREQDRLLPIANVGRIMKQILPPNAKISKEAKETMQECVSEFISFVTGEASDRCQKEKRKTVNGDDICWALRALGFDDYVEPLKRYLNRYREFEGEKAASNSHNKGGSSSTNNIDSNDGINYSGGSSGRVCENEDQAPMFLKFNVGERSNSGSLSRRC